MREAPLLGGYCAVLAGSICCSGRPVSPLMTSITKGQGGVERAGLIVVCLVRGLSWANAAVTGGGGKVEVGGTPHCTKTILYTCKTNHGIPSSK